MSVMRPLPSTSLPVEYPVIILSFDSIYTDLLTVSAVSVYETADSLSLTQPSLKDILSLLVVMNPSSSTVRLCINSSELVHHRPHSGGGVSSLGPQHRPSP